MQRTAFFPARQRKSDGRRDPARWRSREPGSVPRWLSSRARGRPDAGAARRRGRDGCSPPRRRRRWPAGNSWRRAASPGPWDCSRAAAGRQRLPPEHVQGGAGEASGIEGVDEIVFDQVLAARHVDHAGAVRQLGEGGGIQDADGLGGERQQAARISACRSAPSLRPAVTTPSSASRCGSSLEPESRGPPPPRRRGPELAEPHDADPPVGGLGGKA